MSKNMLRSLLLAAIATLTLAFTAPANAGIDWMGPEVPPEGLRIGSEVLEWGNQDGIRTLTHNGRSVVSTTNSYVSPAFTILDIWNSADTNAVLLQAGSAATKDCSVTYVVESRQSRPMAAHELGMICVAFNMPKIKRNEEGFLFSYAANPMLETATKQWRARTGDVVTSKLSFRPELHSTMAKLASMDRPERAEPLQNEEFFTAVSRLPVLQRDRILAALWAVTAGCSECSGNVHQSLYGVAIDGRTVAYSGCGWYLDGARVNCGDSDALAVWDRERGGFYIAADEHHEEGWHRDSATLTVSPPLEDWPPAARERFEAWQDGRSLLTANR